jgi:hypothetical protein
VTDLTVIAPKLANLIRRLSSDQDGEVVATARAMTRMLAGIGADIHDVSARIEHSSNGALSEAEMKETFDAGIKEGIRRGEQTRRMAYIAPQFPPAAAMAMYCYQRIDRLSEWESEFITNMASWTRVKPLSLKQQAHLEKIYLKLGGRV